MGLFLSWWLGGTCCTLLILVHQRRWPVIGWGGMVISSILWPATPFAVAYMKSRP